MSLRLEMLQVARLAPRVLGDAAERIVEFVKARQTSVGGFADRAGETDLYYTIFAIECLFALNSPLPVSTLKPYLQSFGDGEALDMVHLSGLARCWAMLPAGESLDDSTRQRMIAHIEKFRSKDGGFSATEGSADGTLYGCFLATGAYQDLAGARALVGSAVRTVSPLGSGAGDGQEPESVRTADPASGDPSLPPNPRGVIDCIASLQAADGGYANQRDLPMGLTPSTAAAVTLFRQYGQSIEPSVADWLLARQHPEGGFFATPAAPIPDLLSTATALHALSGMNIDPGPIREKTLDFIDTLWSSQGAFFGNWEDDTLDCEYTYYALLALGHLSV